MPYTDGKHSLAKLQVSISEIKQYFHHDIWAAASCCGLQLHSRVGRLAVARRGGGVHHGDGDGQAVVQEKGAALAAQPAWEKHTEEQASIMAWCAVWCGLGCRAVSECRGVGRVEGVGSVEGSDTVDTVDTR